MGSTCLAALLLFACTPRADSSDPDVRAPAVQAGAAGGVDGGRIMSTLIDARPAAIIEGKVLDWGELRPLLNEAAGARVLQEVVLDRQLDERIAAAGIVITDDDVDAERSLFYETLSSDPDVSARLARELRARQGLGRVRFARLLRRNARLRALVRGDVEISDEAVGVMYELVHGPTREARLMVLPTLGQAQAAIDRVESGELFGEVAAELSTDTSAARGGMLAPISNRDATYPEALRQSLFALEQGELSPPVLLGDRYAVLLMMREIEGDGADPQEVRADLERAVRLNQERLLMDRLGRELLAEASVTILDDQLAWSWEQR